MKASGSSRTGTVSTALMVQSTSPNNPSLGLHPAAIITPGGVGNKILSVLRGDADCALMHLSKRTILTDV